MPEGSVSERFNWRSYDLNTLLPKGWREQILQLARTADARFLITGNITSREADPKGHLKVMGVNGERVRDELPWLFELYKGLFRDLAQKGSVERVSIATVDRRGAVLNIQTGTDMRYEAHVDTNPIEGLLYVTSHPPGSGGELVVSNRPDSGRGSVEEVEQDCSIVYPCAGNLIFFDARRFNHYVRPLKNPEAIRIVVAMNFYTESSPETMRPESLDRHLAGVAPTELTKRPV